MQGGMHTFGWQPTSCWVLLTLVSLLASCRGMHGAAPDVVSQCEVVACVPRIPAHARLTAVSGA
jgi:hypothetical protein